MNNLSIYLQTQAIHRAIHRLLKAMENGSSDSEIIRLAQESSGQLSSIARELIESQLAQLTNRN